MIIFAVRFALAMTLSFASTEVFARGPAYEKIALIIGNSNYAKLPDLPNAGNDAIAVAAMLKSAGYFVVEKHDLTKNQFGAALAEIHSNLNNSSQVVFFFAGHGFQIGSNNYLLPTNSDISNLSNVPLESVSLTHILENFATQSGAQIVLLDSCRDNPFAGEMAYNGLSSETLQIENGFSIQSAPINSLISFSTAPGAVALDGNGSNSPYTSSLISATGDFPDYEITALLPVVRKRVLKKTGGFQTPSENSSLLKPIYLMDSSLVAELPNSPVNGALDKSTSDEPATRFEDQDLLGVTVKGNVQKHVSLFQPDTTRGLKLVDNLVVRKQPKNGSLGILSDDALKIVRLGDVLSADTVRQLSYSPHLSTSRTASIAGNVVDEVQFQLGDTSLTVNIDLSYNECDLQAASPLDPDGVGLSVESFQLLPGQALAACKRAVEEHPNESRFHYQLFRAHLASQNFSEAHEAVSRALELGHVRANLGLGQLKRTQLKGSINGGNNQALKDIIEHYTDGHRLGDPMATYNLGRHFIRNGQSREEREQGYNLLHRAKDAGYVEALNELARYFFVSKEGDANAERGLRYFQESADRGNNRGFQGLGVVYKNGLGGIEPNFERAITNFQEAARLNHPSATTSLGRIWAEGKLTKVDHQRAFEWYEEGLSRGDPWGGTNAANLIVQGHVPGLDIPQAAVRAAKAAALSAEGSQSRQAALNVLSGLPKRALIAGIQHLLLEFGEEVDVDGKIGPQTLLALERVHRNTESRNLADDVTGSLLKLAAQFWQEADVRVDLN